jgi:hypothetical protein
MYMQFPVEGLIESDMAELNVLWSFLLKIKRANLLTEEI